jgi:hypothetical protein
MPEDWDQQQAEFAASLVALPRLIEAVEPARLHRAPAPGQWSAHVVVCHLLLDEMNTTMSLRLLLTQDHPSLVAIDPDNTLCEPRFAPLYPDTTTALGVWRVLPTRPRRPPRTPRLRDGRGTRAPSAAPRGGRPARGLSASGPGGVVRA